MHYVSIMYALCMHYVSIMYPLCSSSSNSLLYVTFRHKFYDLLGDIVIQ